LQNKGRECILQVFNEVKIMINIRDLIKSKLLEPGSMAQVVDHLPS
jgi:hypothetical protein